METDEPSKSFERWRTGWRDLYVHHEFRESAVIFCLSTLFLSYFLVFFLFSLSLFLSFFIFAFYGHVNVCKFCQRFHLDRGQGQSFMEHKKFPSSCNVFVRPVTWRIHYIDLAFLQSTYVFLLRSMYNCYRLFGERTFALVRSLFNLISISSFRKWRKKFLSALML